DHGLRGSVVHLHHQDAAGRGSHQGGRGDREGLWRAARGEGGADQRRPGAPDRRAQDAGPERQRPGRRVEDHRRDRTLDGRGDRRHGGILMRHQGNRYRGAYEKVDRDHHYAPAEAVALIKETASVKFDETVEVHLRLGVNVRHAEEQLRGTLALPHGLGKEVTVAVFADGDAARAATDAGADHVGAQDLADRVNEGFTDFDVAIATPDLMGPVVSKLGRILGPQGKMPNPKVGTVTNEIAKAVGEAKAGKVEYRTDRQAVIHLTIGKASFEERALLENYAAVVDEIVRARPAAAKGRYLLSITLATTMGPGIRVDTSRTREAEILAGAPSGNGEGPAEPASEPAAASG